MPKRTLSLKIQPGSENWDVERLCQKQLQHLGDKFREKGITGAKLQKLTDDEQRKLGIRIQDHFEEEGKVFNDPIHGHVELHPLLIIIIDTPQFQRLRHIKQLGGGYFVYPGACHNRFEHSIGVAHLAGQFAQALKSKQPELNITDRDILCVQIAGLCHDLGHGPFSHLFDGMFIPKVRPSVNRKHEENSTRMFDHMVEKNDLKKAMKHYGLEPELDITFIKEMIEGPPSTSTGEKWPYEGRGQDKSFLYEIVANKTNGIDVDKFDYFARDCHHLGIQLNFDHHRFIQFARVCEVDRKKHICIRDKEKDNLRDLFENRTTLHRKACQHRVKVLIETMITDAFVKADQFIKIKGMEPNGEEKTFTLSEAIDNMDAYTKLTDRVFDLILIERSHMYVSRSEDDESISRDENNPDMDAAREILKRIIARDFYLCLGKFEHAEPNEEMKNQWKEELAGAMPDGAIQDDSPRPDDFEIVVTSLDYRMKGKNGEKVDPISNVYFYSKFAPTTGFKINPEDEMSRFLQERFSKVLVRVYLKNNEKQEAAEEHFEQWYNEKFPPPQAEHPQRAEDVAQP